MTTSTSSNLSADAKEFIPFVPPSLPTPTIPYYIDENAIASIPPSSIIYPLIKIPEIEFHFPSSSSTNDNTSQLVLLPSNGCYPGASMSAYYPISSFPSQPSSYRNTKTTQRNRPSRVNNQQIDRSFKLRTEDFPTLPNSQPRPLLPSSELKSSPAWNTIVATPRSPSVNKKPVVTESEIKTDPPSTQKKRPKKQKKKSKESVITLPVEPVTFSLEDETAFPALGQEVPIVVSKSSESTKDSTPGLISKSKVKANHSYQICLSDMFDALTTSTQNSQSKSNKSTIIPTVKAANPLDSNPVPKRGKERENPKPRKPTKLKRIINKELEENKKQRQQVLSKIPTIIQSDEFDVTHFPVNEYTSASCTEESDDDDDDDDDDDVILDHEPTSQLQTPHAHQHSQPNIKQQIHDAGFRDYCSQLIDRQLDELCIQLLLTLKRFQDRKKQQLQNNPERARQKRRFVHGIREVTKHLRLQRLKCVFIAPDCQSIESQGGLNDAIEQIIHFCKEQMIPYVFTLNRQKLGRCLNKISRVTTIGIFDYSGADQIYQQIIEITNENQRAYKQILDNLANHEEPNATPSHGLNSKEFYKILHRTFQNQQQPIKHHIINKIPNESLSKDLPKVPAHYAHSRQTSDTSTIFIDPQLINSIKKQHTRASSGTFDMNGKTIVTTKKKHQRTLSDGAAVIDDTSLHIKPHLKTHSRTPSGCSAISQTEQQDYFEQSKNILFMNNTNSTNENSVNDNDENRLKSIHEDTEEYSANIKRKNVEKWINGN